jgi:hypothetical protein
MQTHGRVGQWLYQKTAKWLLWLNLYMLICAVSQNDFQPGITGAMMNLKLIRNIWTYVLPSILIFVVYAAFVAAQTSAGKTNATTERDGQHDFDPLAGTWKAHTKYSAHPLAGSDTWVEFDGTEVFQKLWDGAMIELSGRAGANGPVGLMLYTYNPQSHQWYVYFASSKDGKVGLPNVGEFQNGRGEFLVQDTLNGKVLLNRYVWSQIASNSPHFEESWSRDGGRTWEPVRIVDLVH